MQQQSEHEEQQGRLQHSLKRRPMTMIAIPGSIGASLLVGRRMRDIMSTDLVTTHPLITIGHAAREIYERDWAPPRGGRGSGVVITPE